jgi:hypothetical protein
MGGTSRLRIEHLLTRPVGRPPKPGFAVAGHAA